MELKKLQLSPLELGYYESSGTGSPIMLIHGISSSGLTYQHQINSPLSEKHRMVAIDQPGHGASQAFADVAEYSIPVYQTRRWASVSHQR
jgi:pimeloyl-ACP methyl ester carboxylesterase